MDCKLHSLNAICKDTAAINCITVQHKNIYSRQFWLVILHYYAYKIHCFPSHCPLLSDYYATVADFKTLSAILTSLCVSFCIKKVWTFILEFCSLSRLHSQQQLRVVFWWSDFSRPLPYPKSQLTWEKKAAYRAAVGGMQSLTAPSRTLFNFPPHNNTDPSPEFHYTENYSTRRKCFANGPLAKTITVNPV
jgi:hypothetical protein